MSWAQSSWTALFLEVRIKSRALLRLVTPADVEPGSGFALVPQPILKPAGRSAWGMPVMAGPSPTLECPRPREHTWAGRCFTFAPARVSLLERRLRDEGLAESRHQEQLG